MSTLIFRTMAPWLALFMAAFSIVVLLRGHNDPGGGFIGGLIAAAAIGMVNVALGHGSARRWLRIDPLAYAGLGVLIAIVAGLLSVFSGTSFMTALWLPANLFGVPGLFDVGVYLVVFGALSAVMLALEDGEVGE